MNTEKLKKRTGVLSKIAVSLSDLYHNGGLDEDEKGFIETLLGAGIFYLPSGKELFTGKISKKALDKINESSNVSLVKEHGFPRKVAGKSLLNEHLGDIESNPNRLYDLYVNQMGRYNLVLKEENGKLKKYQKTNVFETEEIAYRNAGIELVSME